MLPPGARPGHTLYITVYTGTSGGYGYLVIARDGVMSVGSSPYSNAQAYTSLVTVSFPAAALGLHKLALRNGLQSSQGQYGTGDPGYSVKGGVVYLRVLARRIDPALRRTAEGRSTRVPRPTR